MSPGKAKPPPGVVELDHTADLAIRVEADSLPVLFDRAARGMFWLMYAAPGARRDRVADQSGADAPGARGAGELAVTLEAADLPQLLVRWLSELLYAHETGSGRYGAAAFERLAATGLSAQVALIPSPMQPVRELKGVTYHDLDVGQDDGTWSARVVFDS